MKTSAIEQEYDQGLRSYMLSVYNYMMVSVLLTGVVSLWLSYGGDNSFASMLLTEHPFVSIAIMFSPLVLIFLMNDRRTLSQLQTMFWGFAVLQGVALSMVFLSYSLGDISSAFFSTAAAFAGLSLWGYTTKKDLSGWGSFLIMGVVGLIVAMILNIFLASSVLTMVISMLGVLIFAGLMAYDTQNIKNQYSPTQDNRKLAVYGALTLYLDFINMFLFLLRIFGMKSSD